MLLVIGRAECALEAQESAKKNKMLVSKIILLAFIAVTRAVPYKEPELPLCPMHIQYFPQNLPMHCRMPRQAGVPPPMAVDNMAMQPGISMPPGMHMPDMHLPQPGPPLPVGMPGGPILPMVMPGAPAGAKLPVIVMPFYKPETDYANKKKRNKKGERKRDRKQWYDSNSDDSSPTEDESDNDSDTTTDTDTDTDSDDRYSIWKSARRFNKKRTGGSKKRHHRHHKQRETKRRPLYTPVLQYVTKDGYVIYEKKISTNEADNWLNVNSRNKDKDSNYNGNASVGNDEERYEKETKAVTKNKPKADSDLFDQVVVHKKRNQARVDHLKTRLKTLKNLKNMSQTSQSQVVD